MSEAEKTLQLETAVEYVRLAQYSIKNAETSRGWQRNALTYSVKAEQILNKLLSTPEYATVDSSAARAL